MGGGTGTGAAPVIARAVRELGILTVGVVTKPFAFEGDKRQRIAERGILELQQYVHTLIVIPNQNLFRVANDRTTFAQAFAMADEVLHSGVRGVTDLIVMPGLINLDFADIKAVISEMGKAMMGTGEAEGENRAQKAAEMAICNPLLDEVSMKGARGVLINITGGPDLMLFEVEQAANCVRAEVDPDANIIFGNTILDNMEGRIRVSVVATGIDAMDMRLPKNVEPLRPNLKPVPLRPEPKLETPPAAVAMVNPVIRQQEALAAEMRATPQPAMAAASRSRRKRITSSAAPMRRLSTIRFRFRSGRNRSACSRRRSPNPSAAAGDSSAARSRRRRYAPNRWPRSSSVRSFSRARMPSRSRVRNPNRSAPSRRTARRICSAIRSRTSSSKSRPSCAAR